MRLSEEHRDLSELQNRSHLLTLLATRTSLALVAVDQNRRVARVSDAFVNLVGLTPEQMVGSGLDDLLESETPQYTVRTDWGSVLSRRRLLMGPRSGRAFDVERVEVRDPLPGDLSGLLIIHDTAVPEAIDERSAQGRQWDAATGLMTRRYFTRSLTNFLKSPAAEEGAALCWINIDGLREINTSLGGDTGDRVISEVARRIHISASGQDLVGRMGVDEYAWLMDRADPTSLFHKVEQQFLSAIRQPFYADGRELHLSVSVGVVLVPEDGTDAVTALSNAERAMKVAKNGGGDRATYFEPKMNGESKRRAIMRQELLAALRSNSFTVLYQPIVDVRSGTIDSVEALVRMRRGRDLVSAAEFIDVAEEFGLVRAIGQRVIEVCRSDAHSALPAGGRPVPMQINLSASQLLNESTVAQLLDWPRGEQKITLEITESMALYSLPTRGPLLRLREAGFTVAIDDFGVGYSNLVRLEEIRPQAIKIDRSLLVRARESYRAGELLRLAVDLARALGATSVLEGVETESDMALCRELGVDKAQGYLFGGPTTLGAVYESLGSSDR